MLCLPRILLNAALSGGLLSLRNIVKILLLQVAYFGGEKTLKKWSFGVAYQPQKKKQTTEICVIHSSVKKHGNMALFGEFFFWPPSWSAQTLPSIPVVFVGQVP
jgi:hypothetical protein